MEQGLINAASFKLNLYMFPIIAIGAIAGILILKNIPQKAFNAVVQILAALGAISLFF
jgi:uncharacterized membrane protein YfcA